jgi:hypothetical protein
LTLLEGAAPPDERSADLAGLSLRITSRYLEHTLTRDNVRQDEHYDKAMALLRQCVDERLRPALLAHLEAFAAHYSGTGSREAPGMPSYADALLYARLPSMRLPAVARHRPLLPSVEGGALSVRDLERADSPTGVMLCTAAASPLTARLARDGVPVLLDRPGTVVFARACGVEVTPAHARLFTAEPVEVEGDGVAAMLRRAQALLDGVKLRVSRVVLGDFEYGLSCVSGRLHVRQREAFGVTRLGDDDTPTLFGGARDVVVSARHPVAVECIALAASDPALAATILAQAIAVGEKVAHDRHADLAAAGARARASGGQDT